MAEQEKRDPTKFDPNIFRKEVRESDRRLDDWFVTPTPQAETLPETERLEGHSNPGEMLKYKGAWYVAVESYPTTIDEGESFADGGWETVARKATDEEIASHLANPMPPAPVVKVTRSRRAEFLAEHGVPDGANPEHYLTTKQLRQLSELEATE